jgi:transposase
MRMAKSVDFRKRVLEYYIDERHTIRETAAVFKVGKTTIENWETLLAETGSLEKRPLNRTFKKIDPEKLKAYVNEHNDDTLREIAEHFNCTIHAVDQALRKQQITYKKKSHGTSNETKKNASNLWRK